MPLKERIDLLRLKTGQVISEDWFDELGNVLEDMSERGAISYDGYVYRSLIPYETRKVSLGSPAFEFLDGYFVNVHTHNVYCSNYGRIPVLSSDEVDADKGKFGKVVSSEYVKSVDGYFDTIVANDYVQGKKGKFDYVESIGYVRAKTVEAGEEVRCKFLNVFEKVSCKELQVDEDSLLQDAIVKKLSVRDELYVYGRSYLGGYATAYRGDFYEIYADLIHVLGEIDIPDYSIGFIKLSPNIVSNPVKTVTIPPNEVILSPRGVYYVTLPDGVTVEANFNGDWRTVLTGNGIVISDGVNVRFNNSNSVEVTVEMLLIR